MGLRNLAHRDGERGRSKGLHQSRVLRYELAELIDYGRVLLLRVFGELLNRLRRHLLSLRR